MAVASTNARDASSTPSPTPRQTSSRTVTTTTRGIEANKTLGTSLGAPRKPLTSVQSRTTAFEEHLAPQNGGSKGMVAKLDTLLRLATPEENARVADTQKTQEYFDRKLDELLRFWHDRFEERKSGCRTGPLLALASPGSRA